MRNQNGKSLSSVEICAGAGGQALGIEQAGFSMQRAVEIDKDACATLTANRPNWNISNDDVRNVSGNDFRGIDLFAGGVPCPPFSIAGKQLGALDERDLFPEALRIISEADPAAIMLENVRGLGSTKFAAYRESIMLALSRQNYAVGWRLLNACDYGVPQLRPRFILVAIKRPFDSGYRWPTPVGQRVTVGEAIGSLMGSNGWTGAEGWALRACDIAPTIVGGSKKHGGPDLGPSRAREKWLRLGVDGRGVANTPPSADFPMDGIPRLTVEMVARIQGFPEEWRFTGKKTAAYRQVGNAFPPPVSREVANAIKAALTGKASKAEACGGQTELFSLG